MTPSSAQLSTHSAKHLRTYAMLLLPSGNRVYNAAANSLAQAELQCFNTSVLEQRLSNINTRTIAGVPYLLFQCENLLETDVSYLSNLSFLFALYATDYANDYANDSASNPARDTARDTASEDTATLTTPNNENMPHLVPVPLNKLDRFDTDLLSILKFAGKTNEQFTKMLLNTTIMASSFAENMTKRRLRVLDPLCGRGTTLNQALMYGYDAAGIEIDKKDFDAYSVFINRWLKDKRLKHKSESVQLRNHSKTQAHRLGIKLASSKQAYKRHDVQTLDMLNADTMNAREFFKPASFEIMVADLPYGVKHGNQTGSELARSPLQLLEQAIPLWTKLLCPGGALGLSWNTYLGNKNDIIDLLQSSGLSLYPPTQGDGFRHRVDQAIVRDIIIATRL